MDADNRSSFSPVRLVLASMALATCGPAMTSAQDAFRPSGEPLPDYARVLMPPADAPAPRGGPSPGPGTAFPNILITGYWPPTNEMLREFSDNAVQNPGGWIGGNWEGRGYDVFAFFPEFPNGIGRGQGDFEVDYQDTSNDWWPLVAQLQPIGIITFSRANTTNGWELEGGNRTYVASQWTPDYLAPTRPTPELPIMQFEPPLTERYSTLPFAAIIAAVQASGANVNPFSTVIDDGRFLSNFIGYHGCWYHALHASPSDPAWNIAAGHIHVGQGTALNDARIATKVTLRVLIEHLDTIRARPGDMNCDGAVNGDDLQGFVQALLDPVTYRLAHPSCVLKNGDFDGDHTVTPNDLGGFVALLTGV